MPQMKPLVLVLLVLMFVPRFVSSENNCSEAALDAVIATGGELVLPRSWLFFRCRIETTRTKAIQRPFVIEGNGGTIESRQHLLFSVAEGGHLELHNVTLRGDTRTYHPRFRGGAIYNAGQVVLDNVRITNFTLDRGYGGAIYNAGNLYMTNSTIERNAIYARQGGGLYNEGYAFIENSHFIGNSAREDRIDPSQSRRGEGGSIYNHSGSEIRMVATIVERSTAAIDGGIMNFGTMSIEDSIIRNNGRTGIGTSGVMVIQGTRIENNRGGGIGNGRQLTITQSIIQNNQGTGIFSTSQLTITHSIIQNNQRESGWYGSPGGGVYIYYGSMELLNLRDNYWGHPSGPGGQGGGSGDSIDAYDRKKIPPEAYTPWLTEPPDWDNSNWAEANRS